VRSETMNQSSELSEELKQFSRLMEIVRTLRSPNGCSWDLKQTPETMKGFLLDEAQEVAEAVDKQDPLQICEELGDVVMVVGLQTRIAEEKGTFTMADVLRGISDKLISRHPHVFGDAERGISPEKVLDMWGKLKIEEKRQRNRISSRMQESGRFASALSAALQIQAEAGSVGFDFPDNASAIAKISEETRELQADIASGTSDALLEEAGDLLFSVVNVARMLNLDPEKALRKANEKFVRRFSKLEDRLDSKGGFADKTIQEMDEIWNEVKREE